MARPLRIEFAGALYHVTARGKERHDIFFTDDDRRAFLAARAFACFVAAGKQAGSPWKDLKNQIYLGSDRFVE